jgi:ABC-type lipoprotein export system ATPase subunit
MSALMLNRVWKTRGSHRQAVTVLKDITLEIQAGEFVMIEGPSGCGKTTLLAVSAGLLKPERGTVILAGKNLQEMSSAASRTYRASTTGFVYQRSNLLDAITTRENVQLMALLAGMTSDQSRRETIKILKMIGITHLADRRPGNLSVGEEQRFALARALVHKPAIVFADEPTGNLDSASGQIVAQILQTAARTQGAAVLVATHDQRLSAFATRRLRIEDGRIFNDS